MENGNDPVAKLGKELAADKTLADAVGTNDAGAETATEEAAPEEDDGPTVIGSFSSYDEVREFLDGPLDPGDYAIVNDGLVRVKADGSFEVILSSIPDEFAPPVDHTERFTRDLDNLERVVMGAEFESGSILGSVVSVLIELYKNRPKAWSELSQLEQRDLGKQLEAQAKTIVRKVVRVVAEGEEISVHGKLESYSHKGTFDLKLTAASDEETAVQLFRMQGHEVIIMSADAERFLDPAEIETEPDQREIPFADPPAEEAREAYEAPADDSDLAGDADEDEELEAEEFAEDAGLGELAEVVADALENDTLEDVTAEVVEPYAGRSPEPGEEPIGEPLSEATAAQGAAFGEGGVPAADFEASEEELAAQRDRSSTTSAQRVADYTGPREPADAVPGESWHNTGDDRVKYKHPNGKWYVAPPKADDLNAWRAAQEPPAPAADDGGFPASPDA